MAYKIKKANLSDFFFLKNGLRLNRGEILYHGSLTPSWKTISRWRQLHLEIGFASPAKPLRAVTIKPENTTNRHIYKPTFYALNNTLYVHAHTPNILLHTLRSYAKVLSHLKLKHRNLKVTVKRKIEHYRNYISHWTIHGKILLGRCESIISFITALHLIEKTYLSLREAQEMLLIMEKSRLIPQNIDKYNKLIKLAHEELRLKKQTSPSRVIVSYNLVFRKTPITIIQLPWGTHMAKQMIQSIFTQAKKITHLAIIGGVGYIGKNQEKTRVDEIFVPNKLLTLKQNKDPHIATVENHFWSLKENNFYKNKRVWPGTIFTITPQKQVISNSKVIQEKKLPVDAVDMEFSAIHNQVKAIRNLKLACAYYIMDVPYQGLDLGNTYYNKNFLRKLFASKNRGKYYCMEKMINFLTS